MLIRGRRWEQLYNFAWILLAIGICIVSFRLKLWGSSGPGPGFIPFGAGLLVGGCGVFLLILECGKKPDSLNHFWDHPQAPKRILFVILGFIGMAVFMPILGFFLTSFMVMSLMIRLIHPLRIIRVITISILSCSFLYLFFHVIFEMKLPKGIINF